jgi:hypothetical protein
MSEKIIEYPYWIDIYVARQENNIKQLEEWFMTLPAWGDGDEKRKWVSISEYYYLGADNGIDS